MSRCIGNGCLAGLMIFEENAVFARQPLWCGSAWKADSPVEDGISWQNG
jgi:hypothetical protein